VGRDDQDVWPLHECQCMRRVTGMYIIERGRVSSAWPWCTSRTPWPSRRPFWRCASTTAHEPRRCRPSQNA